MVALTDAINSPVEYVWLVFDRNGRFLGGTTVGYDEEQAVADFSCFEAGKVLAHNALRVTYEYMDVLWPDLVRSESQ